MKIKIKKKRDNSLFIDLVKFNAEAREKMSWQYQGAIEGL